MFEIKESKALNDRILATMARFSVEKASLIERCNLDMELEYGLLDPYICAICLFLARCYEDIDNKVISEANRMLSDSIKDLVDEWFWKDTLFALELYITVFKATSGIFWVKFASVINEASDLLFIRNSCDETKCIIRDAAMDFLQNK